MSIMNRVEHVNCCWSSIVVNSFSCKNDTSHKVDNKFLFATWCSYILIVLLELRTLWYALFTTTYSHVVNRWTSHIWRNPTIKPRTRMNGVLRTIYIARLYERHLTVLSKAGKRCRIANNRPLYPMHGLRGTVGSIGLYLYPCQDHIGGLSTVMYV